MRFYLFILFILLSCDSKKSETGSLEDIDSDSLHQPMAYDENDSTLSCNFNPQDSLLTTNDTSVDVVGIIRYSGLGEWYNNEFEFEAEYQVQSLKKSFFLISEEELKQFIGKCVKIHGSFIGGWDMNTKEFNNTYTYELSAIHLDSIQALPANCCTELLQATKNDKVQIADTLTGYIKYTQRPAPDIAYDYELVLEKPLPSPTDPNISLSALPFIPDCIELSELNKLIKEKKKITVYGKINAGYAESYSLQCVRYEKME